MEGSGASPRFIQAYFEILWEAICSFVFARKLCWNPERMDATKIQQLKVFIQQCDSNPAILRDPSLRFFRDYLEK